MARLDTDDWVAPGWIAHMKYMAATSPEQHFLINYQVTGQASDGRLYNFSQVHTRGRTSPFIALVQKTDPRISPYESLHLRMGSRFSKVYDIPPAYAFMVVHGGNRSNRLFENDTYIGGTESVIPYIEPKVVQIEARKRRKAMNLNIQGTDWRARMARAQVN